MAMSTSRMQMIAVRVCLIAGSMLPAMGIGSQCRADLIRLNSGGEVRGEVLPSTVDDVVLVRTLSGAELKLPKREITFIEKRTPLIEEYVSRDRQAPETVEARWELAEWCRVHQLKDQQAEQLELLVDLDPDHAQARALLKHVRHNGVWMTRDEMMTQRGYVQHKGRWITLQEYDLLSKTAAEREAELAWYPKVRLWLAWITSTSPQRQAEGIREFNAIDDPYAVTAIDKFLGGHEDPQIRLLAINVFGRIQDPRRVLPLVEFFLYDGDPVVREASIVGIGSDYREQALAPLIKALGHDSNQVVNRAGEALGRIGDERVVPALIDALITSHKYKVTVPAGNSISIGMNPVGQPGLVSGTPIPPAIDLLNRTGQLPYGYRVVGNQPPGSMKTVTVRASVQNGDVLNALTQLTGQNFGYDERAWLQWWTVKKS